MNVLDTIKKVEPIGNLNSLKAWISWTTISLRFAKSMSDIDVAVVIHWMIFIPFLLFLGIHFAELREFNGRVFLADYSLSRWFGARLEQKQRCSPTF